MSRLRSLLTDWGAMASSTSLSAAIALRTTLANSPSNHSVSKHTKQPNNNIHHTTHQHHVAAPMRGWVG